MTERPRAGRDAGPPLDIGCGALARERVALTRRAGVPEVDLAMLPATLHNRPERIPAAVRERIRRARAAGRDRIFVAYAACGTGGLLDRVLDEEGVERLDGAHCYEVYAGSAAFATLAAEEPGTFYLTDFLARNFDRLVIRGLGLDRHPELLPVYFGNYRRLVYLAQTEDAALTAAARRGARRLGLAFERRFTGYGELGHAVAALASAPPSIAQPAGAASRDSHAARSARSARPGGPREPRRAALTVSQHGNIERAAPPAGGTRRVARGVRPDRLDEVVLTGRHRTTRKARATTSSGAVMADLLSDSHTRTRARARGRRREAAT